MTLPTPLEQKVTKRIRQVIISSAEMGISPMSIVFSVGGFVTPDERDYLVEYEKKYQEVV